LAGISIKKLLETLAFCLMSLYLFGQQIPSGTLLPVMLDDTIDSSQEPGREVTAKLMQEVILPDGGKIKRESKVLGQLVAITPPSHSHKATLSVRLDRIEVEKQALPISVGLRAYATMQAVATARQPVNANSGFGTSPWDWNMVQVGGQAVFNGQKLVKSRTGQVVGRVPEPGDVLAVPMVNPARGCTSPASSTEQSFWVFSTDACGVYGEKNLILVNGIGGPTVGLITFKSPKKITIRGGSAWLLQVNDGSQPSAQR